MWSLKFQGRYHVHTFFVTSKHTFAEPILFCDNARAGLLLYPDGRFLRFICGHLLISESLITDNVAG